MTVYKVGDKAIVRPDLSIGTRYKHNGTNNFIGVNDAMVAKRGKIVTISAIRHDTYKIAEDDWQYTDDMFILPYTKDELIAKLIKGEIDTHTYNTWLACKEGE